MNLWAKNLESIPSTCILGTQVFTLDVNTKIRFGSTLNGGEALLLAIRASCIFIHAALTPPARFILTFSMQKYVLTVSQYGKTASYT